MSDRAIETEVIYTVKMRCIVVHDPDANWGGAITSLENAVSSIDIPEGGKHHSQYIADSFEIVSTKQTHGPWACSQQYCDSIP